MAWQAWQGRQGAAGHGGARRGTAGRNGWPRMANKAEEEPRLARWLKAGCRFELHAWGLKGARGKRKTYQLTRQSAQTRAQVQGAQAQGHGSAGRARACRGKASCCVKGTPALQQAGTERHPVPLCAAFQTLKALT